MLKLECGHNINGQHRFGAELCGKPAAYSISEICTCFLSNTRDSRYAKLMIDRRVQFLCEPCVRYQLEAYQRLSPHTAEYYEQKILNRESFTLPEPTYCFSCQRETSQSFFNATYENMELSPEVTRFIRTTNTANSTN